MTFRIRPKISKQKVAFNQRTSLFGNIPIESYFPGLIRLPFGILHKRSHNIRGHSTAGITQVASGSWSAAVQDPSIKTSMTLDGDLRFTERATIATGTKVPILLLCASADMNGNSDHSVALYEIISNTSSVLLLEISEATPTSWYDPSTKRAETAAGYALAFQKVFLEGDERWKRLLLVNPDTAANWLTNIQ